MADKDFKGFKKDEDTYNCYDPTARSSINSLTPRVGIAEGKITTLQEQMLSVQNSLGGLGTASTKNSTSVVTESTDLVESGAVKDIVGWGNKNLLNDDDYVSNVIINTSNGIVESASDAGVFYAYLKPNTTYTLSFNNGDRLAVASLNRIPVIGDSVKRIIYGASFANVLTFTTENDESLIGFYVNRYESSKPTQIQVEKGSTATAYEPYHASVEESLAEKVNWINAKGYVGRNILPYPKGTRQVISSEGVITNNPAMYLSDYVSVKDFKGLYLSCDYASVDIGVRVACFDGAKNFIKRNLLFVMPNNPKKYQIDSNVKFVRFCFEDSPSGYYTNLMIEDSEIPIKTYETYVPSNTELDSDKCDNTVIGTVEDGTNPTKSYAAGEHMIRGGKFCTVTSPVTTSSTWVEGSNYTSGDVANSLVKSATVTDTTNSVGNIVLDNTDSKYILSAYTTNSASTLVFTFRNDSNGTSYANIRNQSTLEGIASTPYTVRYFYIDK